MDEPSAAPQPTPSPIPTTRAPNSRLAVASAALGWLSVLTACLPTGMFGLLAVMLGMMSLDRIKRSEGALRGRPFAWNGIGAGTAGAIASLSISMWFTSLQEDWNGQLDAAVKGAFAAVDDMGSDAAFRSWSAGQGAVLRREDFLAFATESRARYGAFTGFTIQSEEREPSLTGVSRIMLALALQFEGARLNGSAVARLAPGVGSFVPVLELESLTVRDPERGDLSVPKRTTITETDAGGDAGTDAALGPSDDAPREAQGAEHQDEGAPTGAGVVR